MQLLKGRLDLLAGKLNCMVTEPIQAKVRGMLQQVGGEQGPQCGIPGTKPRKIRKSATFEATKSSHCDPQGRSR